MYVNGQQSVGRLDGLLCECPPPRAWRPWCGDLLHGTICVKHGLSASSTLRTFVFIFLLDIIYLSLFLHMFYFMVFIYENILMIILSFLSLCVYTHWSRRVFKCIFVYIFGCKAQSVEIVRKDYYYNYYWYTVDWNNKLNMKVDDY